MSWAEILLYLLAGFPFLIMIVGGGLVIRGTIKKTKWGVNFAGVKCPECGETLHNYKRLNWFGVYVSDGIGERFNCAKCCIVTDKWGRKTAVFKKER
jgi:hypothetical protein